MKNTQKQQIAELANQYGRQVFATAYRIVGDSHYAEDITQDIYMKLFKKTPKAFDKVNNWAAYLTTMATSASLDLLRKKHRLSEQSFSEDVLSIKSKSQPTPERQFGLTQDIRLLRHALTKVTEQEAKVFVLRFVEELSYEDIAESLKLTSSNVGIILNRTRQKLARLLSHSQITGEKHEVHS
ncbi:sigma-70 family RNA polymerase sigma factor [Kangiella marina]|uniref:Sigma-70 family RNA polymerase sigma factor n=1 Tax=Kangiella marina TaxID=1079178 RepID=A0ABP8IMV4_9GAMM